MDRRRGAAPRFLLIGQCDLLELPRHHEAHAVPFYRMAATAHGRPLPARRPGSRRAQRARIRRRRLGLALALLAAAAIGLTTTFASGPTAPAESRPLSDQAALAGQPAPQTLATRGSLQLMVPIDQAIDHGRRVPPLRGLRRGLAHARRPPEQRRLRGADVERRVRRRRRRHGLQRRLRLDAGRRRRRARRHGGVRAGERPGRLDHALRPERRRHALRPGDRDQPVLRSVASSSRSRPSSSRSARSASRRCGWASRSPAAAPSSAPWST